MSWIQIHVDTGTEASELTRYWSSKASSIVIKFHRWSRRTCSSWLVLWSSAALQWVRWSSEAPRMLCIPDTSYMTRFKCWSMSDDGYVSLSRKELEENQMVLPSWQTKTSWTFSACRWWAIWCREAVEVIKLVFICARWQWYLMLLDAYKVCGWRKCKSSKET